MHKDELFGTDRAATRKLSVERSNSYIYIYKNLKGTIINVGKKKCIRCQVLMDYGVMGVKE